MTTPTPTPNTTAHTVLNSTQPFDQHTSQLRAAVFGHLVRIATPVLTHYHGDLYHDALWLAENLSGPMTFWFLARDYGTHIGTDQFLIRIASTRLFLPYRVSLAHEEHRRWTVTIEKEEPS